MFTCSVIFILCEKDGSWRCFCESEKVAYDVFVACVRDVNLVAYIYLNYRYDILELIVSEL